MRSEALKEDVVRVWFLSVEVKCLENQVLAALGRHQTDLGRDHGSVAMSPEQRALNSERVEHEESLLGGATMKVCRQSSGEACRPPVTGTIGNDKADLPLQRIDLPLDPVDTISPAPMQKHQRASAAQIAVVNIDRTGSSGMW